ncbi:hypothetical protein MESS2_780033 [Mesorhizobium metallidurans STM 2683]|uniref:Uncharacterized protein n=1 Tax=Mesorhizobium metallidurans STM 2683 TaxID=1297569 RepID=M5F9U2_9HYPH|nr:hypothetical protein MESS2_780033 [Mesorhizobium metallidurans STM 2683]
MLLDQVGNRIGIVGQHAVTGVGNLGALVSDSDPALFRHKLGRELEWPELQIRRECVEAGSCDTGGCFVTLIPISIFDGILQNRSTGLFMVKGGDERRSSNPVGRRFLPERAEQPDDEADAERNAEQAEILRPVLVGRNVGDKCGCRGIAGAGNAGQHAPDEQNRVGPGDGADQIVDGEGEHGGEQDRPPSEPVAQPAHDGRENELHRRIDEQQPAALDGRLADADAGQFPEIGRQHRHDHAEADNVEQQRGENERKAPPGGFWVDHDGYLLGPPGAKAKAPYR